MDIIQNFLGYTNQPEHVLHPTVRNSTEIRVARRYVALTDELQKLRLAALSTASISKTGDVKVKPVPPEIAELEQKMVRLQEIANEMGRILKQQKAQSIHDLREIRAGHQNTIESHPNRAWAAFLQTRGEGQVIPEKMRIYWLPGDIAQVPEYKAEEDKLRAEIEASKAALVPLDEALTKLNALTAEAEAL